MKKKIVAWLLVFTMLLSLQGGIFLASAAYETGYKMKLVGTELAGQELADMEFENAAIQSAVKFDLQITAPQLYTNMNLAVNFSFDNSTLKLIDVENYGQLVNVMAGPVINDSGACSIGMSATVKQGQNNVAIGTINAYAANTADGARTQVLFAFSPTRNITATEDGEYTVATFYMALADGKTFEDLDSGSLILLPDDQIISNSGEDYIAKITGSNDKDVIGYGTVAYNGSTRDHIDRSLDRLEKPVIIYPNSDVINLGDVEVEMEYAAVNAPVLLPTADPARTVAVKSVKPLDTAGNEIEAGEAAKVTYTYSLKKAAATAGDPAEELSAAEKAYFSIDATNGTVTIKPGAPIIDLAVVATGSYTNTKGNASTADGEGALAVKHGDAGSVVPGGDGSDDDTPAFSGVKITNEDGVTLVTSAVGSSHTETIGIPTAASENVKFTGMAVDQFGGEVTSVTGTWDDTVTTGSGTTVSNGTVTVASGAAAADFDYKFSATEDGNTYDAKVNVVVSNTVIKWPTLTNDTIVYGQSISELTFDNDGTITDHGTDVTASATFGWDVADDTATLAAGTATLTMKVDYTDSASAAQTATKAYAITVDKANQVISIAQDGDTATTLVNVEIGLETDLAPTVKNATVAEATGVSAVSYGAIGGNDTLVSRNGNKITGEKLSNDNDDLATLTLTAEGNDNYNEATRTIRLYVSNQILRAQIVFDKETPVAGQALTATVTESTDPLQDSSLFDDSGAMIGGLTHSWLRWDGVEGHDPVEIEGAASTMSQPDASTEAITVVYTPVAEDVGQKLILTVVTPTGVSGYQYIDKSSKTTENAVIKGTPNAPALVVESKTTSSLKVTAVDGAEYAILDKDGNALIAPADFDPENVDTDTLTWQASNEFTGLTPNTEYELYIRLKETGTDNASAYATLAAKTNPISIDPDDPSAAPDPVVTFDTLPSVTISGNAKFGETLRAAVIDAVIKIDGEAVEGPFYTEYQWYRVTPAVEDNPETEENEATAEVEEAIADATGTTYELAQDDIDKIIRVKVTPAADSPYGGTISAATAAVEKADGPVLGDGFATTPISATDATDGTITIAAPADATLAYQYRLKVTEGEENEWTDATVVPAAGETPAYIGNLGAGEYELKVKANATTKESNVITLTVAASTHTITGSITSYNANVGIKYYLCPWDEDQGAYVVMSKTMTEEELTEAGIIFGDVELEELESPLNQKTQTFTISGIADGRYQLRLVKAGHLTFVVNNIVVSGADYAMADHLGGQEISMISGDVSGNDAIDTGDASAAWGIMGQANPLGDANGNGAVDTGDVSLIWGVMGRTTANDCTISAS